MTYGLKVVQSAMAVVIKKAMGCQTEPATHNTDPPRAGFLISEGRK